MPQQLLDYIDVLNDDNCEYSTDTLDDILFDASLNDLTSHAHKENNITDTNRGDNHTGTKNQTVDGYNQSQ